MNNVDDCYAELVALAQMYLFQEYSGRGWIGTDEETFNYFKNYALKNSAAGNASRKIAAAPERSSGINSPLGLKDTVKEAIAVVEPIYSSPVLQKPLQAAPCVLQTQAPSQPLSEDVKSSSPAAKKETANVEEATKKSFEAGPPKSFVLEPLLQAPLLEYDDLKKIMIEKFPEIPLLNISDFKGSQQSQKQIKPAKVVILSFQEDELSLKFLKNVAKAIDIALAPVKILVAESLEKNNRWEQLLKTEGLRLIISSKGAMESLELLKKHLSTSPEGSFLLGTIPVCPLACTADYLNDPQLKRALWSSIKRLLSSSSLEI